MSQVATTQEEKKMELKEKLYMTYLIVGIVAFSFGILISYKRLKKEA